MRRAVREERKNKKQEKKQFNLQIKLDRKQIITLIICIVIAICIIAINNYISLGLVLNKNIETDDAIQIELQTSNNQIIPFGDEILVYNQGAITSYNNYGRQTGVITLEDTIEAEILTAGKYIQVINKNKGLVYVYKNKYEVARIKIEGNIYSGIINSDGNSVIEYSSNGNKTELGIYNSSGEKKYNVKLSNNIIGKYVLSDNSRYLAYMDVNVTGISAQTNINIIDLSNIKTNESDTKTVHTVVNSLAYDLYWSGRDIIARFDDNYIIYDVTSKSKEIIEINAGQIVNIGDYNKRYAYTKLDGKGNYVLEIAKMTSDSVKTVNINDVPKYFAYENGIAYVCYAKRIEAYNNFGMRIKNYDSSMVITEPVVFNNGRSVAMAVSNKLVMFTI